MNRAFLILLGVLILGSAGFGLAQLDQVRKLNHDLAALGKERADLLKQVWDLKKHNGELENRQPRQANTGPANAEGDGPPDFVAVTDGAPAGPQNRRGRNDGRNFVNVMSSPEVQKLMGIQQKAALDGHYAALFKQMQLSPADLEKFKNLLVEKQSAVMDVMAAARAEGLNGRENRDQIRQLVQDAQSEVENSIKSTLGDAAYAQYQNYEATIPERNVVSQLQQRLSYSSTPLTDSQSSQLVQILAQTAPAKTNTNGGGFGGLGPMIVGAARAGGVNVTTGGSVPITGDALTQAQGILSAQQLTALQSLQQEQQANAQLMQQMRANFGNRTPGVPAGGANPPPNPAGPGGG